MITGSANFSDASTRKNDENMLVIRGDRRVADIYLSEFMRLFNHFQFRGLVRARAATGPESARSFLVPDELVESSLLPARHAKISGETLLCRSSLAGHCNLRAKIPATVRTEADRHRCGQCQPFPLSALSAPFARYHPARRLWSCRPTVQSK